jgi:hypothetical protein
VDLLQGVLDGAAVVRPGAAHAPEAREAAHHDHVLDRDGEGPVHELRLRDVGDATRLAAGRAAEDLDPPRPRAGEAGHQLEQRALARTVGPDDREQAPRLHGNRDVLEGHAFAVARGHVAQPHVRVGERVGRVQRAVIVVVVAWHGRPGRVRRTGGSDGGGLHMRHSII